MNFDSIEGLDDREIEELYSMECDQSSEFTAWAHVACHTCGVTYNAFYCGSGGARGTDPWYTGARGVTKVSCHGWNAGDSCTGFLYHPVYRGSWSYTAVVTRCE